MDSNESIKGAIKRAEERLSNDLPEETYQKQQAVGSWKNWPDWNDDPDFPNWEDIGGPPPK